MIYDMNALKAQGIAASALADWGAWTTCTDPRIAYERMIDFYNNYGFDVFWAFKDQQMTSKYGRVLSDEEKHQYIINMLGGFPG